MQFTDAGEDKFHDITREIAQRGGLQTNTAREQPGHPPALRDRARPRDPVVRRRSTGRRTRTASAAGTARRSPATSRCKEAKDLALVLQTGALPVEFRTPAADGRLGDARRRLAAGGEERRHRRPDRRRALPAHLLPLPRRRRGDRPRHLRGLPVRGDPDLQRHADAAGLRRHGAHLRGGRRREHRHLRTHQGGVPRRANPCARRSRAGYSKGFHTIIDANVVTAITALVLFAVATAGVKGFALMLLIGTAISMITAVAATRAILGLLAGFSWFDNPPLHGRARGTAARSGSRTTSSAGATSGSRSPAPWC